MQAVAPSVSIVVPVFNEVPSLQQDRLTPRIQKLLALLRPEDELLLVDGGSTDESWPALQSLAAQQPDRVFALRGPKGRALQMNAGASRAKGAVLLFLHADTELDCQAWQVFLAGLSGPCWGRFDVRIEGRSKWLPVVAWFMNWRSALTQIATGDQAIFSSRELFIRVGGFPDQPLMEDIEFCKRLKQVLGAQFRAVRSPVKTSGRRWDVHGAWPTIVLMWRFRFQYWRGVPATELARQYADSRERLQLTVAVFAKYPQEGRVKTRLEPLLGARQCAALAAHLLLSTLDKLNGVHTVLWTDGGTEEQWQALLQGRQVQRMSQPSGHLGVRMQTAVETHLETSETVLLLGPDAVQFSAQDVHLLQQAAKEKGLAFIPALDGGYVAMACTHCLPAVFSEHIQWGTDSVAEQTRQALMPLGLQAAWLPAQMDIDLPADYLAAVALGHLPANWVEHSPLRLVSPTTE